MCVVEWIGIDKVLVDVFLNGIEGCLCIIECGYVGYGIDCCVIGCMVNVFDLM